MVWSVREEELVGGPSDWEDIAEFAVFCMAQRGYRRNEFSNELILGWIG